MDPQKEFGGPYYYLFLMACLLGAVLVLNTPNLGLLEQRRIQAPLDSSQQFSPKITNDKNESRANSQEPGPLDNIEQAPSICSSI